MKRRPLLLLALILLLGLLTSCGGGQTETPLDQPAAKPADKPSEAAPPAFVLGAGDNINITVWRFDDLKRSLQIDPSGHINFPFAGQVYAAGRTQEQLARELEKRLAPYYVNPRVDVALSSVRSASIHILGEVKNPTSITLDKKMLLTEAIARAGGLTNEADEYRVLLFRRDGEVSRAQVVSLRMKEDASGDIPPFKLIYLNGDDIIYVPPTHIVDATRFLSQLVGILEPFTSVGRSVIIGDQVYKVFRNKSDTGVVVQP